MRVRPRQGHNGPHTCGFEDTSGHKRPQTRAFHATGHNRPRTCACFRTECWRSIPFEAQVRGTKFIKNVRELKPSQSRTILARSQHGLCLWLQARNLNRQAKKKIRAVKNFQNCMELLLGIEKLAVPVIIRTKKRMRQVFLSELLFYNSTRCAQKDFVLARTRADIWSARNCTIQKVLHR